MAQIRLQFGHLSKAGHTPAEIVRIVKTLEASGIRVNLQIKGQESLKLLSQLPNVQEKEAAQTGFMLGRWLFVGLLASLVSITYGWLSLMR